MAKVDCSQAIGRGAGGRRVEEGGRRGGERERGDVEWRRVENRRVTKADKRKDYMDAECRLVVA